MTKGFSELSQLSVLCLESWTSVLKMPKVFALLLHWSCWCHLERVLWQCGVGWVKISKKLPAWSCALANHHFKRLKFHPGTFSTSKSKVLIIWSMLEIVPHAHFTDAQTGCCGWEAILQEKPSQERKVMSNIAPSSIHRVCREGKMAHLWSISY